MEKIPDSESDFSFKGCSPDGGVILSRLNNGKLELVQYNYDPLNFFTFASLNVINNIRNINFKIEDDFFTVEHDNEILFQSISGESSVLKEACFIKALSSSPNFINYAFIRSSSIYTITLLRKDLSFSKPKMLIKDITYHKYDDDHKKIFAISDKKLYVYNMLDISDVQVFSIPDNFQQHIIYDIYTLENISFIVFIGNKQLKIYNASSGNQWSFPLNAHPKKIFSYFIDTLIFLYLPNEKLIILDVFRNGKVIESKDKTLIECNFDSVYLTPLKEAGIFFDKKQMSFVRCTIDFMKLLCLMNNDSEIHWEFLGHLLGFNNFAFNASVAMKFALQRKMPGYLISFMNGYYISRLYHILSFTADPALLAFVPSDFQKNDKISEFTSESEIVEAIKPLVLTDEELKREFPTDRLSEIDNIYSNEGHWSPSTLYLIFKYAVDFHLPPQKIHPILQSVFIPFILFSEQNSYIKKLIKEKQTHLLAMNFLEACITISDHILSLIPPSGMEAILGLTCFFTTAQQNHFPIPKQAITKLENLAKNAVPRGVLYNMIRYHIIQNPENHELDLLVRMKDSKVFPTVISFPSPMLTLAKKYVEEADDYDFEPISRLKAGFDLMEIPVCQDLLKNYSVDALTNMYCK